VEIHCVPMSESHNKKLTEAYTSVYQRKDLVAPEKDPSGKNKAGHSCGNTPPDNPKTPQGGDHVRAVRDGVIETEPERKSRYRAAYENYKAELQSHHRQKFFEWMDKLANEGYDIDKWDHSELVDTYIRENKLYKSAKVIMKSIDEEGYDHWRDRNLEKYGTGWRGTDRNSSPQPTGKPLSNKERKAQQKRSEAVTKKILADMKKKYGDGIMISTRTRKGKGNAK